MAGLSRFIADNARLLQAAGIEAATAEMELMLCHVLNLDRLHLYLDGSSQMSDEAVEKLNTFISRRLTRYPLQYILEEAWFYGRKFFVSPQVMIPTPETEILCERAVECVNRAGLARPRILDLGVGSGAIAVTMALEVTDCSVLAVDISTEALEVARRNAINLGAAGKIGLRQSNFFTAIADDEKFELILSNPPYITTEEYSTLPPEVLACPKESLLGGTDGLDAIRTILADAPKHLNRGGRIMFEIGFRQCEAVRRLVDNDIRFQTIDIVKDLNGHDRVVVLGCRG
ncbi:MAG TPA: peptide chain release factor N(5)-glutamine methyltransferase [Candidatus Deferrimicrobium sp.]|nr:peptide chain release factor N(5)-glutamine methyltransferase [Candidatus Deferrimicrobium sp.]